MAEKLQLEVVTPDRLVVSETVDIVMAMGAQGEFGILAGHVPFLTPLQAGELRYRKNNQLEYMAVSGGFAERYNLQDFRKNAVASIENIIARNSGRRVAVVCHGGIINIWAAHVLGIDKFLFFAPEYTSINRFLASGKGQRSMASLNETAHLRDLPVQD